MTTWQFRNDPQWKSSVRLALILHGVLLALLIILPQFSFDSKPQEIQFVRLMGGGDRTPGWITSTERQVTEAKVHDGLPVQPKPQPREEVKTEPAPSQQETVPALQEETSKPKEETTHQEETPALPEPEVKSNAEEGSSETARGEGAQTEEVKEEASSGTGVARAPGPEGPGRGATSDAQFAGADRYMLSVEAEVNKNFRYRSQGSKQVSAVVHFYINKRGRVEELILMQASGIASLDQAAQSAVKRSGFPPLPMSYPASRLGITYRFYNLKK